MNETGGIRTHKDLDICNLGIELVEEIYSLTSQLYQAAISIPSNINFLL